MDEKLRPEEALTSGTLESVRAVAEQVICEASVAETSETSFGRTVLPIMKQGF